MGRPAGASNKRTKEFVSLYETLVIETKVNPVEVLFKLCKSKNVNVRRQAASDLLPYRYPKQAAEAPEIEAQNEFLFSWEQIESVHEGEDESVMGESGNGTDDIHH